MSGSSRRSYEAELEKLADSEAELGPGVGPLAVGDGQLPGLAEAPHPLPRGPRSPLMS